jgi:hypothetical protein
MNAPRTLPSFDNRLSWDLMPGGSYTFDTGTSLEVGWSFTRSIWLAW